MTAIRAMIVEDEPLASRLLARMLQAHPDVEVVGVHLSPEKAVAELGALRPDVLFLDVKMPGIDGFALLERLPEAELPLVVFVTAHDEYALRAFEFAALDFLLKPFDEPRLAATVERIRARLAERNRADERAGILEALEQIRAQRRYLRRLPVWSKEGERAALVPIEQVIWIEADGKQLLVHTTQGTFGLRGPLRDLEDGLDPEVFVRVSRSAVVNVGSIREIQKWFRGDYLLVLRTGEKVKTSASHRAAIEKLLRRA